MKNQVNIMCVCGKTHVWWHDCEMHRPEKEEEDAVPLTEEQRERLVGAWQWDGRDVMFNKAKDDLTVAGRVTKWLREVQI